jgi:hypothetical protein
MTNLHKHMHEVAEAMRYHAYGTDIAKELASKAEELDGAAGVLETWIEEVKAA